MRLRRLGRAVGTTPMNIDGTEVQTGTQDTGIAGTRTIRAGIAPVTTGLLIRTTRSWRTGSRTIEQKSTRSSRRAGTARRSSGTRTTWRTRATHYTANTRRIADGIRQAASDAHRAPLPSPP